MKGQFLVISSVVVGLILISTASTISQIKSNRFQSEPGSYYASIIKTEAAKVDKTSDKDRENFKKMVGMIPAYTAETSYWRRQNCFNVTLRRPGTVLRMKCVG